MVFFSSFEPGYIWLPLIGFVIGVLATMIGSGGGFFFPFILIMFFHVPAQVAVATSLAAAIPLTLTGCVGHYRKGNVHLHLSLIFATAGVAGAVAGAFITGLLTPGQLKSGFGGYSILLSMLIFFNLLSRKKSGARSLNREKPALTSAGITRGAFHGLAGGIISGTFGTSGAAPVLAGLMSMNLPMKLVTGTSLMVIMVNTISALTGHFLVGRIDLLLVILLTSGSIIGAWIGPGLLERFQPEKKERSIKLIFALIALIGGLLLIIR
jgi:uncharacterized protein